MFGASGSFHSTPFNAFTNDYERLKDSTVVAKENMPSFDVCASLTRLLLYSEPRGVEVKDARHVPTKIGEGGKFTFTQLWKKKRYKCEAAKTHTRREDPTVRGAV